MEVLEMQVDRKNIFQSVKCILGWNDNLVAIFEANRPFS